MGKGPSSHGAVAPRWLSNIIEPRTVTMSVKRRVSTSCLHTARLLSLSPLFSFVSFGHTLVILTELIWRRLYGKREVVK